MSGPCRRGKHRLEHSSDSEEEDESRHVQAFHGYQGESSHQHEHAHQNRSFYPYQQRQEPQHDLPWLQQIRQQNRQYLHDYQAYDLPQNPQERPRSHPEQMTQRSQESQQGHQQYSQPHQYPTEDQHEHQDEGQDEGHGPYQGLYQGPYQGPYQGTYQGEHQHEGQEEVQEEVQDDPKNSSDDNSSEDQDEGSGGEAQYEEQYEQKCEVLDEGQGEIQDDSQDEGQYEGPVDESVKYTIDPQYEDPAPTQHQVSSSHPAYGNYATAGARAERVTQAFGSLGLTSVDPQPGPSQAGDYPQAIDSWFREKGLSPISYPKENPYRQGQSRADWYHRRALPVGVALNWAEEWDVRVSVACGCHEEEIAGNAGRSVASVINYILGQLLMWKDVEDEELNKLMAEGADVPLMLGHLNSLMGPLAQRWDDEVEARCLFLLRKDQLAQSAEMAGSAQPGRQESPEICQPGEPAPPNAKQKVFVSKQTQWTESEDEMLEAWLRRNNRNWALMKDGDIPGRTKPAAYRRWETLRKKYSEFRTRLLTEEQKTFIKCELAREVPLLEILARPEFEGFSRDAVSYALRLDRWMPWTSGENEQVLSLQEEEGNEWARISTVHPGGPRGNEEVKARYEYLILRQLLEQEGIEVPALNTYKTHFHPWTIHEDEELALKLAQGWTQSRLQEQGFHGLTYNQIHYRVQLKRYSWSGEDNAKVLGAKPRPDGTFDWVSTGKMFQPARKANVVKARRILLEMRRSGRIPGDGVIYDEDMEH